jgi:hypothetical protein
MRFGMWNVKSLYSTGTLKTVARELGKCKLDLTVYRRSDGRMVALQRHRVIAFYEEGNVDNQLRTHFFAHKRIISVVRRVKCVSNRMLYIILKGCWCNIIVLDVQVRITAMI